MKRVSFKNSFFQCTVLKKKISVCGSQHALHQAFPQHTFSYFSHIFTPAPAGRPQSNRKTRVPTPCVQKATKVSPANTYEPGSHSYPLSKSESFPPNPTPLPFTNPSGPFEPGGQVCCVTCTAVAGVGGVPPWRRHALTSASVRRA